MINTTCAGGIVINENTKKVCVVAQGILSKGNITWSLPKGHQDKGEDLIETAKREIYEETGLKNITLLGEFGFYERYRISLGGGNDESELKKIYMFYFSTSENELSPKDELNPEAKWVEIDKVADLLTHEKDKEFFNGVREFL